MSSEDDDLLNYTPLQRSQVSTRESKPDREPSRLSLTFRKSQNEKNKTNEKTTPSTSNSSKVSIKEKKKTTPSTSNSSKVSIKEKKKTTPSKSNSKKVSRKVNNTPTKSRADQPDENCSDIERARWNFLYSNNKEGKADMELNSLKRKIDSGEESSREKDLSASPIIKQKRKNALGELEPQSTAEELDGVMCLHCKFPINSFKKLSHTSVCVSKDLTHHPRCPAGSKCHETREEHFWRYNHNEKSPDTAVESPCAASKANTVKSFVVIPDSNISLTNNSRYNDFAGSSRSKLPSVVPVSNESPEIVLPGGNHCQDSIPLFDLNENEYSRTLDDNKSISSENSDASSNLLNSYLIPHIDVIEDDQATVLFDPENSSTPTSSFKAQEGQENSKSPAICIDVDSFESESPPLNNGIEANVLEDPEKHDNSRSETPDLFNDTEVNALKDPEGDELIDSLTDEAVDQFAVPVLKNFAHWLKYGKESETRTPAAHENTQKPGLRISDKTVQPVCIHFHYHEASPALSSTSKESGQTSIRAYFKPTQSKKESCCCDEKKTLSKEENITAWKGLMGHRQKKEYMPLPNVSWNSSSEQSTDDSKQSWRKKDGAEPKTCPFYKYIPDTHFVVDAFSYGSVPGVTAYFLSHFHYDHYYGLKKNFNHPIYCSDITAKLVNKRLGVPLQYLNPLPMGKPQLVYGVEVTLLEANHCPGAVMFLFKVKPDVKHLHVGDFRAQPSMESYSALHCTINTLFLDTTYCSPEHVFPTQERMIEKCVSLAQDHHQRNNKTLFVVGSYTIGKERVFKAIASSLNCSIWVNNYKKQVLKCINDKDIEVRLTNCKTSAKVHVLPMAEVKGQKLKNYLNELRPSFSEIVGMCPTGWEFTGASSGGGLDDITSENPFPNVYKYGIPYSEHSSFSELRRFVQFIKPKKIIPTVNNGNKTRRKQMEQHFSKWQTTQIFS